MQMTPRTRRHTDEIDQGLAALETYLQSQLYPVAPNPEFAASLHSRLLGGEVSIEPAARLSRKVFFTVATLVSSVLIVIGGVRATMKMIEAIKDMRQVRNKPVLP